MKARANVLLAAALLIGGASACSDLTGVNARADGVYQLQTVNGNQVPYSYVDQQTGNTVTVQNDTYSLNSDGTYSELAIYRVNNGTQSQTEAGTWIQNSSVVTFSPSQSSIGDFTSYQGTLGSSSVFSGARSLTISINGSTAVYSE